MTLTYYNEWEPYPAEWLRRLMLMGEIPLGDVDETDIRKVQAEQIEKYKICHFFAGVAGWSYALKLAGWPKDREVWTGSCPCQPFSAAGKQKGFTDERHLWPTWFELIKQRRPKTIFMEQVRGAITHGWFDEVSRNMENEGYGIGAAVLPACSVGAPHKRDRLWLVAHANNTGSQRRNGTELPECASEQSLGQSYTHVADAAVSGWRQRSSIAGGSREEFGIPEERRGLTNGGTLLADAPGGGEQRSGTQFDVGGFQETFLRKGWDTHNWYVEPAVGRVANGIPARSHKLRAYGNAIVPQVAQAFIEAFLEAEKEL